mmetsp:Transcript_26917/g.81343  ORF Transcript_26917/g.81343 Transcript_26917/m.81343 type:complete len:213 (-) Transcript_26917:261-899(-)
MGEAVRNTTTRARPLPTSRGPQTRHEPRAATDTPAGIQGASCHRERVAGRTRTARNLARALTDGVQRPPWFRNQTKRRTAKQELTSCRSGGRSAGTGAADLLTTRQPRGRGPRSGPATEATQTLTPRRRRAARTSTPGRKSHDERLCRAAAGVAARPSIRPGATRFKVVRRAAARGREAVRVRHKSSSAGCCGRAAPRESVAPRGVLATAAP